MAISLMTGDKESLSSEKLISGLIHARASRLKTGMGAFLRDKKINRKVWILRRIFAPLKLLECKNLFLVAPRPKG